MHIHLETTEKHAVQAYSETQIQINQINYRKSLIVSKEKIITHVQITDIDEINHDHLHLLIHLSPELIILGHTRRGKFPPFSILAQLAQQRIGVESMDIGGACRTYNILLGEGRQVVAMFLLNPNEERT